MDVLGIGREMESIAQTGLHFSKDAYDRERFGRLRVLAAELLAAVSDTSAVRIHEWSGTEFGYATPKVDVRAFVVRDGTEVLLVRENTDGGRWTLPGGWADVNETPSEAVAREVREESGYAVRVVRLLAVLDRERQGHEPPFPYHVYKIFFHCEIEGAQEEATGECGEAAFFSEHGLPELSKSRVLPEQIARLFRLVRDRAAPCVFD